jgi:hypothetical protein
LTPPGQSGCIDFAHPLRFDDRRVGRRWDSRDA